MLVIENIRTEYKELFTVEFRHLAFEQEYDYLDITTNTTKNIVISSIFENLLLQTDEATKDLFLNHEMDFHYNNTELICYAKIKAGKLYRDFVNPVNLRFLLFANTEFLRRTDILPLGSNEVYLLTNVGRTGSVGDLYLTVQPAGVGTQDKKPVGTINPEQNCLAVLEISTSVTGVGYRIFNAGVLQSPFFKVLFIQS